MQHHVAAVASSGYAAPIATPPVGSHLPATYTMSVLSLLPIASPGPNKLEHKIISELSILAMSSCKSVVAVLAGGSGGTGFLALDNGLVVTSWRAVGFYSEVTLRYDDGRRGTGRVVYVNSERDVAFVLPATAPRLSLRTSPLPRMGEQVSVLIASSTATVMAAFATVSSESQGGGPAMLDPDLTSRTGRGGCPVIDAMGNVFGVITAGSDAGRGVNERSCRLLPAAFFSRDMRPLDVTG